MKRSRKYLYAVLSLALMRAVSLNALVEDTLDPKTSLTVTLSTTAPNRISFEGGAIVDVILDENKFQSMLHQKTGQAFLTPLKEIKEHPTSVTVMTSSGDSQTLSVFAEAGAAEIVVLKDREISISKPEELSTDTHSPTVEFLNQLIEGAIPPGYGVCVLPSAVVQLDSPIKARPLRLLEGPFERILVMEIHNPAKKQVVIHHSSLKKPNDLWAFLPKTHLEPGETTLAMISTKKEV